MSRTNLKSLSYVLGVNGHDESHVLPINAIKSNSDLLFTGGRDGVIASYDHNLEVNNHIQLHTDWVNDIELLNNENLVSCSSDLSVKLWNYQTNNYVLIGHHHDYVKALTVTGDDLVISGGLDRFVNVWDVKKNVKVNAYQNELSDDKGSIYSLSSNKSTGLVAFGDNAANILLFDPKSSRPICELQGHRETIKSLIVGENYLLSGSSDHNVNLWDLRANKVLKSYNFENSVWSLYSDNYEFNEFYTGDSKGRVYRTNQDITQVIGHEKKGVLSINKFNDEIWTSSMENSDLNNWTDSSKSKQGEPGMIKARLLNNRRYVVTLSTSDEVKLWDIVRCVELKNFGNEVGFEDVIDEYQTNEILPTWCRVTVKAGRLFIVVSETSYLNTEVYGDDIEEYGLKLDPETRYSLGKIIIFSIFQKLLEYEQGRDHEIRDARIKELKGVSKLHILSKLSSHENSPAHSVPHSQVQTPIDEHKSFFSDKLADSLSSLPPASAPAVLENGANGNINNHNKKDDTGTPSSFRRLKLFGKKSAKNQTIPISEEETAEETTTQVQAPPLTAPNTAPPSQAAPPVSQQPATAPNNTTTTTTTTAATQQQQPSLSTDDNTSTKSQPNSDQDVSRKSSQAEVDDSFQSVLQEIKSNYDNSTHANQLHVSNMTPPPKYEVPIIELPHDLIIIINERVGGSSNEIDLYSEFLSSLNFQTLETLLPKWIGNFLLKNRYTIKDFPKIGFTISRLPSATDLPNITNGNCRLNAYNMLRVKRILTYITDRMESKTSEMTHHVKPEDWLEVLCNENVLPNTMTLSTLKATIWRSSGDIQITYRRKSG